MEHTKDKIWTQITLLHLLFKVFAMFNMRLWYDKENCEENVVVNIAIRCRNCGKNGLSMKNKNTNYKDMITKFVLNTVLHHVGMSWIIENKQQLEYDIAKHNPDWITDVPWYNTYICRKLHGTVFENIYYKWKN